MKKYFSATPVALFLFFWLTQFARADGFLSDLVGSAFSDVGYFVIGKIAFGLSYLLAWVSGVAIAIEAWLVGAMLGINQGVFQSDIVQKGFSVTLGVANLGFVLGIIIIAIATILRSETYGYKKILWKLIAAAILVNFSLVIVNPIFSLGNSFTQYFLTCVDPGGGGCNGTKSGLTSMNDFAAGLAGAFNPQVGLIGSPSSTLGNNPDSISLGQGFGQMLVPILSVGFVELELVSIAIILAALIVMLLMRYIWIAMLAILMPFAWLGWVFPNLKDWWSKWWNHFIRWTFFAPIVVFFLWLAMQTAQSMRNGTAIANQQFSTYTSNSNPIWAPIANFLTGAFSPIIAQLLNTLLLIGLTVGGIIVADKMSITGAKATVKAVEGAGKASGKWMGKSATRAGLRTGAWAARKTANRTAPGSLPHRALTGVSTKLNTWASHPNLKTAGSTPLTPPGTSGLGAVVKNLPKVIWSNTRGLASTVFSGAVNGSGLFGKATKDWECQNCVAAGFAAANRVKSGKKPNINCTQCGATNGSGAGQTNWKQV